MRARNILLIVMDTMRRDFVYDNLDILPNFRRFSEDSVVFTDAISPSPWTIPAHASIFTGKYPSEHGMHEDNSFEKMVMRLASVERISENVVSKVHDMGYETVSISANYALQSGTPFAAIFDKVIDLGPYREIQRLDEPIANEIGLKLDQLIEAKSVIGKVRVMGLKKSTKILRLNLRKINYLRGIDFPAEKGGKEVVEEFSSFLRENEGKSFLAFLNFMEAHAPHQHKIGPFSQRIDAYDLTKYFFNKQKGNTVEKDEKIERKIRKVNSVLLGNVRRIDAYVGEVINQMKHEGIYDDSLIIITSDHGESLGENSYWGHEYFLHDALTLIPLLVKYPGQRWRGEKVEFKISTLDLANLILSWVRDRGTLWPQKREIIFSEAYGIADLQLKQRLGPNWKNFYPVIRKRIWHDGFSLTLDGTSGSIESFSIGTSDADPMEHSEELNYLINRSKSFLELKSALTGECFRFPETAVSYIEKQSLKSGATDSIPQSQRTRETIPDE